MSGRMRGAPGPAARSRRARHGAAVLLTAALAVALPRAAAAPSPALNDWRAAQVRLRLLVENDAAAAQREAARLEAALPADATAADRATALNARARAEHFSGAPDRAAALARAARAAAERAGDRAGEVEADLTLATASLFLGRLEESYEATTRALTRVEGVDRPELLAEAMFLTAGMYQRRGQLEEAVTTAMRALDIARRSQVPLALVHAHRALGVAFLNTGRAAESRDHYLAMLEAARAARSGLREADALLGLASTLPQLGELGEAERRNAEAIALYHRVGSPLSEAVAGYNLAEVYRRQGRLHEALMRLDALVLFYERSPNRIALWWTLRTRSEVLRGLRRRDAAEADLRRAYALTRDAGLSFSFHSESARQLAAVLADRGDHRAAYGYLVEASEMTTRAAREGASARIMELTRRYQAESKQRELDQLARQRQVQETRLRHQALEQRWLWTVLALSAVSLAGTAYFLARLRRSHRLLAVLNADLERRVAARTAELEAANGELEAFAYSVSHDLRAPVRQIHGFATLLAQRAAGHLDPECKAFLDGISACARRMAALIDDLLSFSRTARAELNRAPVDLAALTRDVVRELAAEAQGREIDWRIGALPVVEGARNLLRIALANLISNALKFTGPHARARIEVGTVPGADRETVVFVRDDGVGFDMHDAGRLFGVFQRLRGAEEFEGTGIGLATVRRIVGRHGGRTWAEGKIGEGATFFFSLPSPAAPQPHAAAAQETAA